MPYSSRWTIPISQITLPTYLFGSPHAPLPDNPCFIDSERPEYALSKKDYRLWSQRFAAGLIASGLKRGDVVLLYSGNTIFFPVAILGIIMAGGIFTGANPGYNAREVSYQLSNSGAKYMLCSNASLSAGIEAAQEVGLKQQNVFVFDDGYDTYNGKGKDEMGCRHWSALLSTIADGSKFEWAESRKMLHDTIALNYSSGTTGLPKGVEVTHLNYVSNTTQHMHLMTLADNFEQDRSSMRWLCIVPMYHAMGQTIFSVGGPYYDIPVYIMRRFAFEPMLEAVQKYRITDLTLVPPVVVAMAKSPITKNYDLSSVKKAGSGAAPLGKEVVAEFETLWPQGVINVRQGYGMTETTCSVLGWDPTKPNDASSCGEPNANVEIKLVNPETLEEVTAGDRGELWARGANIMKGYWKNEKETRETITPDGWLRTGDIAIVDKGLFYIVDRMKELIKVKGNQVAPAELEAQLLEHPGIADAAVIGVTVDGDEAPRAYVVRSAGASITAEEVVKYMESKVSRHKRLVGGVRFVEVIEKNPSGKILRRLYRERASKEVGDSGKKEVKL